MLVLVGGFRSEKIRNAIPKLGTVVKSTPNSMLKQDGIVAEFNGYVIYIYIYRLHLVNSSHVSRS